MASQILCLSPLIVLPYVSGERSLKSGSLKKLYWVGVIWGLLTESRGWGALSGGPEAAKNDRPVCSVSLVHVA